MGGGDTGDGGYDGVVNHVMVAFVTLIVGEVILVNCRPDGDADEEPLVSISFLRFSTGLGSLRCFPQDTPDCAGPTAVGRGGLGHFFLGHLL